MNSEHIDKYPGPYCEVLNLLNYYIKNISHVKN